MARSLSDWGIVAEIVSAIVVTLSLIFVGLQIRDNTRASRAETYQGVAREEENPTEHPAEALCLASYNSETKRISGEP
jgi:hypothetical protein